MLPEVEALFTLVRSLANRTRVTDAAVPKWLVQRHSLGPLVARAGDARFRETLARATLDWATIEHDLPEVVEALTASGVRVAVLKGAHYAKALYATPAERPMVDVDLLVPHDHVSRARAVLGRLGFQVRAASHLHHAEPWVRGDRAIDLHWNIIGSGRSRIDLGAVWSRVVPAWPDGASGLEANDVLVFHLVHLARNRLCLPLINVIDAARLLDRADAAIALARAAAWGVGGPCTRALRFCRAILDGLEGRPVGWLGPSVAEVVHVEQPGPARKVAFDIVMAGGPRPIAARVLHFGANRLWRPRGS